MKKKSIRYERKSNSQLSMSHSHQETTRYETRLKLFPPSRAFL